MKPETWYRIIAKNSTNTAYELKGNWYESEKYARVYADFAVGHPYYIATDKNYKATLEKLNSEISVYDQRPRRIR